MTDKATVEIPSPVAGKVLVARRRAGRQVVAVGSELIRIEVEGAGNVNGDSLQPLPRQPRRRCASRREAAAPPSCAAHGRAP